MRRDNLPFMLAATLLLLAASSCTPPGEIAGETPSIEAARERAQRLAAASRKEVVELHRFIEEWSNGVLPDDEASYARFSNALAQDFVIISPDGTSQDHDSIVEGFRTSHGRWRSADGTPSGVLRIEEIEVVAVSPPLALVSYQEWQELPAGTVARLSSVLFRESDAAPGGVEWVHLHESWLPGASPQPASQPATSGGE